MVEVATVEVLLVEVELDVEVELVVVGVTAPDATAHERQAASLLSARRRQSRAAPPFSRSCASISASCSMRG